MTFRKKLLLALACTWAFSGQAQTVADYLNSHKQDITDTIVASKLLDGNFFSHQVFLLGEAHGVQKPQELDFNLLRLLNRKAGVRIYVGEFDFAKAYYLNEYLQNGNEKLLDTVFADWVKNYAQWANTDFQNKIRRIRTLNKSLPAKDRIRFAGIDAIHNTGLVADYFTEVIGGSNLKPLLPRFQKLIGLLRQAGTDSLVALEARQLLAALNRENNQGYQQSIYQSVLYGLAVCGDSHTPGREQAIFRNFKYLYRQHNWHTEKLYGFWGFTHVLQAKVNGGRLTPFAAQLVSDPELGLKGKVVSLSCLYSGSKMMLPTPFLPPMWQEQGKRYTASSMFNNDGEMMAISNITSFKEASQPGTATLFKLTDPGNPFAGQKIEVKYSPFMPAQQRLQMDEPDRFLPDYFQYLILVRESPATTPILN